jgi:diguanylate cyclase (GGDEF)-like protein
MTKKDASAARSEATQQHGHARGPWEADESSVPVAGRLDVRVRGMRHVEIRALGKRLRTLDEFAVLLSGLAVIGIGYGVEALTDQDLSVSIVYVAGVAFMAWSAGIRAGLIGATAAAVAIGLDAFADGMAPGAIASQVAISLIFLVAGTAVIARWRDTLERSESEARVDQLTGAPNRLASREWAGIQLARLERQGESLSVAFLDLDGLKRVNDRDGHASGDAVLVLLANCAREILRPTDLFARVGGDEFVLLLSDTDHDEAINVTRRIQDRFRATNGDQALSIAAGLVTWRRPPENLEDLFVESDALMYEAKRDGGERLASKVIS